MMNVGDYGYLYSYNVHTGELACRRLEVRRTEGEYVTGVLYNGRGPSLSRPRMGFCNYDSDYIDEYDCLTVRFKPGVIHDISINEDLSYLAVLSREKNDCDVALIFAENEEKLGRGRNAAKLRDMARCGKNWVFYETSWGTKRV